MSLFKGSATLTRYQVRGDIPLNFWEFVDRRVRANAFIPIDDAPSEQLSVGWCSVHDFLDTKFAYASYALVPYIVLGLRIDRRQLSTAMLRKHLRLEIAKATHRGRPALSRVEREGIKESVFLDLMRQTLPTTQVLELVWDTGKGEVWLGSSGRGVRDLFEDHFKRSFDLGLWPRLPWFMALELADVELRPSLEAARPLTLYHGEA